MMKFVKLFVLFQAMILSFVCAYGKDIIAVTVENTNSTEYKALKIISDELYKYSSGKMKLKIFPNGQLGSPQVNSGLLSAGEIDMLVSGVVAFNNIFSPASLAYVPYGINTFDKVRKVLDGKYGDIFRAELDNNNILLDSRIWEIGFRQTTSNKPIYSIEDMKGLKVRIPSPPGLLGLFTQSVGARVTIVPYSELYIALQTNLADSQENPLQLIKSNKLYEVQKYLAITNHMLDFKQIFWNKQRWERFSPKEKKWISKALDKAVKYFNKTNRENRDGILKFLKSKGMIITKPDLSLFRKAMLPYFKKLELEYGKEIVDSVVF